MTALAFAGILFICLLIIDQLLLKPIDLVASFQMPYWISFSIAALLFAWLLGD